MTDRDAPGSDLLLAYVEQALELQDNGCDVPVEELCREHPDLVDAVREALGQRAQVRSWAGSRLALEGMVLGERYQLGARIGAGAMGTVYRAHDLQLKREVAVKLLQPHLFGRPDSEARFLREAEALAVLRHPNVVTVYDRGVSHDGLHFLVMEFLDGVPMSVVLAALSSRVAEQGWEGVRDGSWIEQLIPGIALPEDSYVRLCARWAADLAAGLAAAHAAGIFHRDVKPSNVFLGRDCRARLLDFGVAVREDDATLTRGDSSVGTPVYMAPELALGRAAPGAHLDVYSLSATLYHLLGAQPPYSGESTRVLAALRRDDPPLLGRLHRRLPSDLQAVVERGMARAVTARYATAAELEADLRAFLEHRPVTARRRGPVARTWRRVRRSRAAQILALVAIAALVSTAGWAWMQELGRRRAEEHLNIAVQLPPSLTLGRRPVVANLDERRRLNDQLDRAVALLPDDIVTRSLRAAFRFDHGDALGAAADMAALSESLDTDCSRAIAARYAAAARTGARAVLDLHDLPEPAGAPDRFLVGYHRLRALDYDGAAEVLISDEDYVPSRQLALIAQLPGVLRSADQKSLRGLEDDAARLERDLGRATTRTRYITGTMRLMRGDYAGAVEALEQAVELGARDYTTQQNLGIAYRRTRDFGAAEVVLRRVVALRPADPKAVSTLAKVLADQRRFDEALAVALQVAPGDGAWLGGEAVGYTEFQHAMHLLASADSDDVQRARECAGRAVTAFESLGRSTPAIQMNSRASIAARDGDWEGLCEALFELLQSDADNPVLIYNLAHVMPKTLGVELTAKVRSYLLALADQRARRADPTPSLMPRQGVTSSTSRNQR